jgi:cell division septal protein FtsQ
MLSSKPMSSGSRRSSANRRLERLEGDCERTGRGIKRKSAALAALFLIVGLIVCVFMLRSLWRAFSGEAVSGTADRTRSSFEVRDYQSHITPFIALRELASFWRVL